MASLTKTAIISRKIIRYSIYGLFFIILTRYTLVVGSKVYRSLFPEPPPAPTVDFGKIPAIPFPDIKTPNYENLTFILETPEGTLPQLPVQDKIYFMPKPSSSIRSLENAQKKVGGLKFDPDGREITQTLYLFEHKTAPSTLEMNIVTEVFSISYDLRADISVIENNPPTPEAAIAQTKSYLAKASLLPDDISGPTTHEFIKISEGKFVSAVSLSEADLIKVNLYRKSFNEVPSLTANPNEANIWFLVGGGSNRSNQIIAAEYHYFPINEKKYATYPLRTAGEAWDDLKSGEGFIANLGENSQGIIKIRRVYLAYYDAGIYTEFYQPMVVFEGDNNFTAYVPAIDNQFYGKDE